MITKDQAIRTHRLKRIKSDKHSFEKKFECKVCGLIFRYRSQCWFVNNSNTMFKIPTCKEYVMQEALG